MEGPSNPESPTAAPTATTENSTAQTPPVEQIGGTPPAQPHEGLISRFKKRIIPTFVRKERPGNQPPTPEPSKP